MFEQYNINREKRLFINYSIRNMNEHDIPYIAKLIQERENNCSLELATNIIVKEFNFHERETAQEQLFNNIKIFVAVNVNNIPIAFGKISNLIYKNFCEWFVTGIIVSAEYRGAGVGSTLFKYLISEVPPDKKVYSVINANNLVSYDLHLKLNFNLLESGSSILGFSFEGGKGYLFELQC